MPRVVPSQIVEFIDQTIPKAKQQRIRVEKIFP